MSVVYTKALHHMYRNKRRGGLGHLHTVNGAFNTEVLLVKMTRGSQQIVQKKNKDFFCNEYVKNLMNSKCVR